MRQRMLPAQARETREIPIGSVPNATVFDRHGRVLGIRDQFARGGSRSAELGEDLVVLRSRSDESRLAALDQAIAEGERRGEWRRVAKDARIGDHAHEAG